MATPLPDALRVIPEDLEQGKAWIRALVAARMDFHFDDSAETIVVGVEGRPLFLHEDCGIIEDALDALYSFDWRGEYDCPIGYMLVAMEERDSVEVA